MPQVHLLLLPLPDANFPLVSLLIMVSLPCSSNPTPVALHADGMCLLVKDMQAYANFIA